MNDLHWKSYDVEKAEGGSQTARFEALIKAKAGKPAVKLIKTYKVFHGSAFQFSRAGRNRPRGYQGRYEKYCWRFPDD
ncbi:MAG: hypothetical protein AMJ43_11310 [Coxiella sp. DG_40]|nr:MAG: hypothetical protein AMJ43_11310 [Coxiella sp. DG_40]